MVTFDFGVLVLFHAEADDFIADGLFVGGEGVEEAEEHGEL
jgi:hypothetical protein